MREIRVIPTLLLRNGGLVKTVKFKNSTYVGDSINAIKIFNEKEVDEIVFLDIDASRNGAEPNYDLIEEFASEAFFPLAYGGGIQNLEQEKRVLRIGVEKIVLSSAVLQNPELVTEISDYVGSSSVVVCLDVKKSLLGKHVVFDRLGRSLTMDNPVDWAKHVEQLGAGEIILHSADREGTYLGYDIDLIKSVSSHVTIPVVGLGGARGVEDFSQAVNAGAAAVAAGSFFVFFGKHRAVLITYPKEDMLAQEFGT